MQSKMFSLPWQRRCLHLQLHKHRLSSTSQETRRMPSCKRDKASMLCGDHNYCHPCVKILCLWRTATCVSGNKLTGKKSSQVLEWANRRTQRKMWLRLLEQWGDISKRFQSIFLHTLMLNAHWRASQLFFWTLSSHNHVIFIKALSEGLPDITKKATWSNIQSNLSYLSFWKEILNSK